MEAGAMLQSLLTGVLLPGVVALILFALGWAGARMPEQGRGRALWGALALGGGFALAYWLTLGWPEFPPVDTTRWLPYAALAGALLGLLAAAPKSPWWLTALLRLIASAAWPLLLLRPIIESTWQEAAWLWLAVFALALFVLWTITDFAAQQLKGAPMPLALGAATGLLALALLLGRSALLAQAGGMLAAAVGAGFLVALWRPNLTLASGALPVFALTYAGLLLSGHFFAEVPGPHAVLLALAPAGPVLAALVPEKRKVVRAVLALLLALALAGTATGALYFQQSARDAGAAAEADYEYVW